MNISIIKATTEHAKEISRICSTGWRQTVEGFYSEEYQIKNIEYWYNHKRVVEDIVKVIYTHVAMVDKEVAGTIGGTITEPGVSEIFVFYVDDVYRYKGIGTELLDAFTKEHIKKGATEQYVSVQEGNELGIPFYKSRGFQQKEQKKRFWRQIPN
ncbi:GNAT family N-acetyltransferase [Virgibacillus sp. 179-BFC.A HS]|uniref:GNAT family N-acetyltransferase n=1 Tax=Tigheibacillus jepli TaxID=3035914 RepID=A0ABU5CJC3_9BACI|nr:GNAT family N-acetyltransferase [Virgibacillus sp. 179-BFC.A HS]MDY0406447.1 GNAT family N-acetyltransferase [Virgibacillus sp. 179-BFC.A HS]